jgi:hypothetical protein
VLLPDRLEAECRSNYQAELAIRASGKPIFTNTSPGRIHDAIRMPEVFPNLKFIFVQRHKIDLAFKIFQKNYSSGNYYSYDLQSTVDHIDWYYQMIEIFSEKYPDDSCILEYQAAVQNPNEVLDRVGTFLRHNLGGEELDGRANDSNVSAPYRDLIAEKLKRE